MNKKRRHAYKSAKKRINKRIKDFKAEQLDNLKKYKNRLKQYLANVKEEIRI